VSSARAGFYHMGLSDGLFGRVAACELEWRERPDQLRVEGLDMAVDLGEQRLLVLGLEKLPTTALDHGCHPADKTGYVSAFFP
jgi:hypothetical protein